MVTTLIVPSRPKWNDTGLDVQMGEELTFTAYGEWMDWTIQCTAKGFDRWYLAPFRPFRRVKDAAFFTLIGALNKDLSTAFVIGEHRRYAFPGSGRLFLFANDVPWAYGNNRGQIEVKIE